MQGGGEREGGRGKGERTGEGAGAGRREGGGEKGEEIDKTSTLKPPICCSEPKQRSSMLDIQYC